MFKQLGYAAVLLVLGSARPHYASTADSYAQSQSYYPVHGAENCRKTTDSSGIVTLNCRVNVEQPQRQQESCSCQPQQQAPCACQQQAPAPQQCAAPPCIPTVSVDHVTTTRNFGFVIGASQPTYYAYPIPGSDSGHQSQPQGYATAPSLGKLFGFNSGYGQQSASNEYAQPAAAGNVYAAAPQISAGGSYATALPQISGGSYATVPQGPSAGGSYQAASYQVAPVQPASYAQAQPVIYAQEHPTYAQAQPAIYAHEQPSYTQPQPSYVAERRTYAQPQASYVREEPKYAHETASYAHEQPEQYSHSSQTYAGVDAPASSYPPSHETYSSPKQAPANNYAKSTRKY